ncbi:MAG: TetR/AcrR family transcriptional regulator [Pseudomonadota bacterium]
MRRHKGRIRAANEQTILQAAEQVFAELGFKGATTAAIAERAGVPKANVHYYFATKEKLYRRVIEDICSAWFEAARTFDLDDDPAVALKTYIAAKMALSRSRPLGSRIWAMEVIRGAPVIEDYLATAVKDWLSHQEEVIRRWIAQGRLKSIEPKGLFYMIWATTQHYADFAAQIEIMNGGRPLSDAQFTAASAQVTEIILKGVGLSPAGGDR